MTRRPVQIVVDAVGAVALGEFWAAALADRGCAMPAPPPPHEDWLFFQRVPEAKRARNRVHLDLQAGGGHAVPLAEQQERVAAEVARLEALGATREDAHTQLGTHWVVMRDPEGNEFCV